MQKETSYMSRVQNNLANLLSKRNHAPIYLVLLTVMMFAAIETCHPYFFLKGDNLDQNLPYYVHNIRSFASCELPVFNFHQYLGTPVFSCIQSAAFYLPNYLALLVSKLLLGHYFGTMEIIALFHLIITALGFFQLMRYFGLNVWSSGFGALAWTFGGFVITVGSVWIQVVGYAAYFPWILLYSLRQANSFDLRSFAMLIVLRVLSLSLGYPPYFIYTVTFDILVVTICYFVIAKDSAMKDVNYSTKGQCCGVMAFLLRQAISYLCVALISAPYLLPAMHQIRISAYRNAPLSWEEYSRGSNTMYQWLTGLFRPFANMDYFNSCHHLYLSHIGWLTLLFCVAAFWQRGVNRKLVATFSVMVLLSYLWASETFVTRLVYEIPFYNRQRYPFKIIFFTSFFLTVLASFGFDEFYKRFNGLLRPKSVVFLCVIVFVAHIGNLVFLHILTPHEKVKKIPYLEPLAEVLKRGRIISVDNNMNNTDKPLYLLGFNYSTLYSLYHFAGYETLVSEKNLNASMQLNYSADFFVDSDKPFSPEVKDLEYFRKWGVMWYVVGKNIAVDNSGVLKLAYHDANRNILYDSAALPLVFWQDNPNANVPENYFSTNTIKITTNRQKAGTLVVNVLHNPFFSASIDGEKNIITESRDMQMLVSVPPGKHIVDIVYKDPYMILGSYISLGTLAALIMGMLCRMPWQAVLSRDANR